MLNGPFSIVVGYSNPVPTMIGLTDRKKLRPLVVGISEDKNTIFMSSEEASFKRLMIDNNEFTLSNIWHPKSGTAVIAELGNGIIRNGLDIPIKKNSINLVEVC